MPDGAFTSRSPSLFDCLVSSSSRASPFPLVLLIHSYSLFFKLSSSIFLSLTALSHYTHAAHFLFSLDPLTHLNVNSGSRHALAPSYSLHLFHFSFIPFNTLCNARNHQSPPLLHSLLRASSCAFSSDDSAAPFDSRAFSLSTKLQYWNLNVSERDVSYLRIDTIGHMTRDAQEVTFPPVPMYGNE